MGVVRRIKGPQVVKHADQLRPSLGYDALVVAFDGDIMPVRYNPVTDTWAGDEVDWSPHLRDVDSIYGTATYQGNDASMTIYHTGCLPGMSIDAQTIYEDFYLNGAYVTNGQIGKKPFELNKWLRAGLKLQ